jgi:hypothetical protein
LNFHINCHGLVGGGFPVNSTEGLRPRAHKLEVVAAASTQKQVPPTSKIRHFLISEKTVPDQTKDQPKIVGGGTG